MAKPRTGVTKRKRERLSAIRDVLIIHFNDPKVAVFNRGLAAKDISDRTGIPESSVYRLLENPEDSFLLPSYGIELVPHARPKRWIYMGTHRVMLEENANETLEKELEIINEARKDLATQTAAGLKWWEQVLLQSAREVLKDMPEEDIAANFESAATKASIADYQNMLATYAADKDAAKMKIVFILATITPTEELFGRLL